MRHRFGRFALLLVVAAVVAVLVARHAQPSITGRWRDQSPAALLYEFRDDGSVWLMGAGRNLPVFRYEIAGRRLTLHDGMGRRRAYRFWLEGDRLRLRELGTDDSAGTVYRRETERVP